jgi:hypothetical protein
MPPDEPSKWSNPVMWLVVGLPVVSMIFGTGLVAIANRDSDDAIVDKVERTAQMQVADLSPHARAKKMKLSAVVRVGGGAIDVIPVQGEFDRRQPLKLSLLHPTHAADDRVIDVLPSQLGWHAAFEVDGTSEWNVRLAPADDRWRIGGRLPKGQQAVALQPALPSDG